MVDVRESQPTRPLGTLGRYELLRRLAVGGMGELFLARARSIGGFEKLLAIKRILPHLAAQPQFLDMFLAEARIAATLEHPNIVHVADLGHEGDDYFLVMPYLDGVDLRALVRRLAESGRVLSPALAMFVVAGVAAGLDHAHEKRDKTGRPLGLIHRDVSPENVFVTYEGEVKLLDFGIAKAAQAVSRTDVGVRRGKAPYMSPEQAEGTALDPRSDLFSLGVLLYELTCGILPFAGEGDLATLHRILHDDPRPPSQLVPGYPPALEAVVLRALARSPAQRFQSAREFRAALDALARQGPEPPATAVELAAFLIATMRRGASSEAVAVVEPMSLPPPPVSASLLVDPVPQRSATPVRARRVTEEAAGTDLASLATRPTPRPRNPWPIAVGVLAGLAAVALAWRWTASSGPPEPAPAPAPVAAAPTPAPPREGPAADPEQLLGLVNQSKPELALDYAARHEALHYLRAHGFADRIDDPLHVGLDLVQARDAARPCEVFDAALATIERVPIAYFRRALAEARTPRPGVDARAGAPPDRGCDDLESRRGRALAALARLR